MSQLLKLKVWSWDWGKIQRKISEWFPLPLRDGGRWIWQTAFPQLKGRSAVYTSWTPESWLVSSRLQGCMGPPSALLSIAGLFLYCLLFFFCVLCTLTFIKFHSIGAGISLGFLPLTPPPQLLLLLLKIPFGELIYYKPNTKLSYMRWTISYLC